MSSFYGNKNYYSHQNQHLFCVHCFLNLSMMIVIFATAIFSSVRMIWKLSLWLILRSSHSNARNSIRLYDNVNAMCSALPCDDSIDSAFQRIFDATDNLVRAMFVSRRQNCGCPRLALSCNTSMISFASCDLSSPL